MTLLYVALYTAIALGSICAFPHVFDLNTLQTAGSSASLGVKIVTFLGFGGTGLSLFTLGITPYITAQIILPMLAKFNKGFADKLKEDNTDKEKIFKLSNIFALSIATLSAFPLAFFYLATPTLFTLNGVFIIAAFVRDNDRDKSMRSFRGSFIFALI